MNKDGYTVEFKEEMGITISSLVKAGLRIYTKDFDENILSILEDIGPTYLGDGVYRIGSLEGQHYYCGKAGLKEFDKVLKEKVKQYINE